MKKALIILLSVPALVIFNYKIIALSSAPFIYRDFKKVPTPDFIIIPGAGNPDNNKNLFFKSRVESAVKAHQQFPFAKIVCIGRKDNHLYNEPDELKSALLNSGISESMILTDTEGFNTFDMLVTIKEKYRGNMLFVSQRIHLQRIIFAAGRMSIPASGLEVLQPMPRFKQKYFRNREIVSALRMTASLAGYKISKAF